MLRNSILLLFLFLQFGFFAHGAPTEGMVFLGRGSFGQVFKADPEGGPPVAIKVQTPVTSKEMRLVLNEGYLLGQMNSPWVVKGLGCFRDPQGRFCTQMERYEGSLAEFVSSLDFSGLHVRSFMTQILQGLRYLHAARLVHCDIKPDNILVKNTPTGPTVAICDFGFASHTSLAARVPLSGIMGTRGYEARELLSDAVVTMEGLGLCVVRMRDDPVGRLGPKVDMFAIGCTLAEMLLGRPFFTGANHYELLLMHDYVESYLFKGKNKYLKVSDCEKPGFEEKFKKFRENVKIMVRTANEIGALNLLRGLLQMDPEKRMTAEEALRDPFLIPDSTSPDFTAEEAARLSEAVFEFQRSLATTPLETLADWDEACARVTKKK